MNNVSSDVMRGFNDLLILKILLESDNYGYEISKNICALTNGEYTMKETTLYSAINRLERDGFISSYSGDVTNGKPRTYYSITVLGKNLFLQKSNEWRNIKKIINYFIGDEEDVQNQ